MKNNTLIIFLLTLIIGLFIGYTLGSRTIMFSTNNMSEIHEEMEEMMHEHETNEENDFIQHSMDEMMSGFEGKSGEEFEEAFLRGMIIHHIGAIEMAKKLLEETDRPELVKMSNDIITVQKQEIEMMKGWLKEWFSS